MSFICDMDNMNGELEAGELETQILEREEENVVM